MSARKLEAATIGAIVVDNGPILKRGLTHRYVSMVREIFQRRRSTRFILNAVVALLLSPLICPSAHAETPWVVGIKTGAALGLLGIEAEREWSGWSLVIDVSGVGQPLTALFIGRRYSSSLRINRSFFDARIGTLARGSLLFSFLGIGAGYELRLSMFRFTVEVGVGLINFAPSFTPISQMGVFLGLASGWSF